MLSFGLCSLTTPAQPSLAQLSFATPYSSKSSAGLVKVFSCSALLCSAQLEEKEEKEEKETAEAGGRGRGRCVVSCRCASGPPLWRNTLNLNLNLNQHERKKKKKKKKKKKRQETRVAWVSTTATRTLQVQVRVRRRKRKRKRRRRRRRSPLLTGQRRRSENKQRKLLWETSRKVKMKTNENQ